MPKIYFHSRVCEHSCDTRRVGGIFSSQRMVGTTATTRTLPPGWKCANTTPAPSPHAAAGGSFADGMERGGVARRQAAARQVMTSRLGAGGCCGAMPSWGPRSSRSSNSSSSSGGAVACHAVLSCGVVWSGEGFPDPVLTNSFTSFVASTTRAGSYRMRASAVRRFVYVKDGVTAVGSDHTLHDVPEQSCDVSMPFDACVEVHSHCATPFVPYYIVASS